MFNINFYLHVWDDTMDGNEDAFVEHGAPGIRMVLDNPELLLFETNHWEDSYKQLVALKIQDRVTMSDAYAFQKGRLHSHRVTFTLPKPKQALVEPENSRSLLQNTAPITNFSLLFSK